MIVPNSEMACVRLAVVSAVGEFDGCQLRYHKHYPLTFF